ncbi:uncharacterized protein CIMG_07132 [Coccidioides immitis RS]|uniref:Pentatricopeptide repeat protein n=4 Tax=Coccidioides immitis TaxID=5501 RepID=A0A0E1S298_COCIM|nr:uncharacterized protein CIMG_07132 [Coccidioides immitis RS]EAS31653.2 hypothetical protein CIMG_07132 [Coccidioides immitis RS]KMP04313.1 hypothetical protein CIRG_04004 [Coccidioides immitis RMSCC 2394]KMU87130.1 hypothetical protein CIHG_05070 [Coccidioides immitis H538.4]
MNGISVRIRGLRPRHSNWHPKALKSAQILDRRVPTSQSFSYSSECVGLPGAKAATTQNPDFEERDEEKYLFPTHDQKRGCSSIASPSPSTGGFSPLTQKSPPSRPQDRPSLPRHVAFSSVSRRLRQRLGQSAPQALQERPSNRISNITQKKDNGTELYESDSHVSLQDSLGETKTSLLEGIQRVKKRDVRLWRPVDSQGATLPKIQLKRRQLDECLTEEADALPGFAFNPRTYGIEFEARWNSLYPYTIVRQDWKRNFDNCFANKHAGMPSVEIWNLLRVQKWPVVADWAKHFSSVSSGKSFWSELPLATKRLMWPDIAFWLLLNSPGDVLTFFESTDQWPSPSFSMVSECFLYLDAFYYKDLTSTPENKHHYHSRMHSLIGPHRWPVISASQRGIHVYLKHCEPDQLRETFEKIAQSEVYVPPQTLLYLMDLFYEFADAENSLRALRLVPSRLTSRDSLQSEEIVRHCCKLLSLDSTCDENGVRSFRLLPEVLGLGIEPQRAILNVVIQNALKMDDPDMAWDILNYSKVLPDSYAVMMLLNDATTRGDALRVETCRRMIASNPEIAREPHIISKVLHGLYEAATPETIPEVFKKMMQVYCQGHDPQPLKDLGIIQGEPTVRDNCSSPSSHALVIMVAAYLQLRNSSAITLKVYDRFCELVRHGHNPIGKLAETSHVYDTFLMALRRDRDMVSQSITIVRNMYDPLPETAILGGENRPIQQARPSMVTWNILLAGAMAHGRLEVADIIREMMQECGAQMDVPAWNVMLRGYADLGLVMKFTQGLKEMLLDNLTPNRYTIKALKAVQDQGRLREGLEKAGVDPETLTLIDQREEKQDSNSNGHIPRESSQNLVEDLVLDEQAHLTEELNVNRACPTGHYS